MPFQKGNKMGGRKPGIKAKIAEAYTELLAKEVEKEKLPIIKALISKAKTGDIAAVKEIHERLMGKAEQPITGKDGGALQIEWLSQSLTNQDTGQKPSTCRVSAG